MTPARVSADPTTALCDAVSQQAELLALLAGSVHAAVSAPAEDIRPLDTVRLADLTGAAVDPLPAFGMVAPQFAADALAVVADLGRASRV